MTSELAIIGLTFKGTDVQVLDGLFLEITQGLDDSPEVRGKDVTIPSAPGQLARPRVFHSRKPVLSGWVRGAGSTTADIQASYRTNVRAMNALFDPADAPGELVATLEDGWTATTQARTLSVIPLPEVPHEEAKVSIEMLALEDWVYEEAP